MQSLGEASASKYHRVRRLDCNQDSVRRLGAKHRRCRGDDRLAGEFSTSFAHEHVEAARPPRSSRGETQYTDSPMTVAAAPSELLPLLSKGCWLGSMVASGLTGQCHAHPFGAESRRLDPADQFMIGPISRPSCSPDQAVIARVRPLGGRLRINRPSSLKKLRGPRSIVGGAGTVCADSERAAVLQAAAMTHRSCRGGVGEPCHATHLVLPASIGTEVCAFDLNLANRELELDLRYHDTVAVRVQPTDLARARALIRRPSAGGLHLGHRCGRLSYRVRTSCTPRDEASHLSAAPNHSGHLVDCATKGGFVERQRSAYSMCR